MSEGTSTDPVFVISQEALADQDERARCDACNELVVAEDDGDGYDVPGTGIYLWKRGDRVEIEKVPLCASCASAIGVTASLRWEIEEEEG